MKAPGILLVVFWVSIVINGQCRVPLTFQYVFGKNNARVKSIRPELFFDSQLQINLAKASTDEDTNQMRSLIERGADVNFSARNGMRPLFWALINMNFNSFKFLLDHGADPNAVVVNMKPPAENALTLAARLAEAKYLVELLSHGANPNTAVSIIKKTAIFTALSYHKTNNIAVLLKYGADINFTTTGGTTPMNYAIERGSFQMALFLFESGANPFIRDKWGYSAIDIIREFGDKGVVSRSDKNAYGQLLNVLKDDCVTNTAVMK